MASPRILPFPYLPPALQKLPFPPPSFPCSPHISPGIMPRAGVKQTQAQRARNKENNFALAGELKSAAMEYEDKMGEIADSYGRLIKAVYNDTVGKVKIGTFIANNKELLQEEYNKLSSETRKALVDKLTMAKDDKLGKVCLSKRSIQKDFDHAFKNIHLDVCSTFLSPGNLLTSE
ncbi:hypothetical protein OF83DRAFT_1088902 [Amylostereum chailletii]|nr:hypothetical protein OF83DRAFT_1088902 [Amylostereum chailletii]